MKKAGAARVKDAYFNEKETAATEAARSEYRKENPPVASLELDALKEEFL